MRKDEILFQSLNQALSVWGEVGSAVVVVVVVCGLLAVVSILKAD